MPLIFRYLNMGQSRTYRCGTPIVLLLAFVLAFLACVSVPISQTISLFTLDIRQADTRIRAGLWGFCVPYVFMYSPLYVLFRAANFLR